MQINSFGTYVGSLFFSFLFCSTSCLPLNDFFWAGQAPAAAAAPTQPSTRTELELQSEDDVRLSSKAVSRGNRNQKDNLMDHRALLRI